MTFQNENCCEKAEENYLITLDKLWLYEIRPLLAGWGPQQATQPVPQATPPSAADPAGGVTRELHLLTAQVAALQATMQDLYETVFESNLGRVPGRD